MAGLHLKSGWFEEYSGRDDVMELNIVHRDRERRDADGSHAVDVTSLTDAEIEDKIERLKGYTRSLTLPDKGQKVQLLLQKCIDEKNRRKDLAKSISGRRSPMRTERYGKFETIFHSCSSHSTTPEHQRSTPVRGAVQQRELKPDGTNNADKIGNAFEADLRLVSSRHKLNGQQHSNNRTVRRSPRKPVFCSPRNLSSDEGELKKSFTRSEELGSSMFSSISGEESARRLLTGKREAPFFTPESSSKKHLSFTPECSTKKIVVVLDEDDEKPKQQHKAHSMSLRKRLRKKDIRIYYPERNHPESVEITLADMACLAPCSYLSSVIMNFYIQYLQQARSLSAAQKNDYHFFNTFFYNKLEEALHSQVTYENGNFFAKLRRWFKGINIFEKAYIFLPIHACQHWSLAIISIPAREDEAGPIILHLDSLGLHTSETIFLNIRSYLKAEWEHLNTEKLPPQVPIAEKIWKDLPNKIQNKQIQVPQQENDYDCGLFVLFFMERFIEEAPPRLRKTDFDRFGRKWFQPAEASHLRDSIRVSLEKLFKNVEKGRLEKGSEDIMNENVCPVVLEDME